MKLEVYNIEGKETGRQVEIKKTLFGNNPNDHAIYLEVKHFMANQRQGNHKTKNKWEITASTKKIKKQKGTGTARAGSVKSGVMRGGGRFHGPEPRSYGIKLNKKVRSAAKKSALLHKFSNKEVKVIEEISFDKPSTKDYQNIINALDVAHERTLLVTKDGDQNIYLSSRNLPFSEVSNLDQLNTYELLKAKSVVFTEDAINNLENLIK
tara:strand:- start:1872 stop:2498 length:627 start_codon:yes stop_codon:yes gene_type:complete